MEEVLEPPVMDQDEECEQFSGQSITDDDFYSGKIYCANCINCKLVPTKDEGDTKYTLKIRCAAGKWKKKLGDEKLYKYATIFRRYLDTCSAYDEMGDAREFIRELRKSLPNRDEPFIPAVERDK
jgi:hypothetical protein